MVIADSNSSTFTSRVFVLHKYALVWRTKFGSEGRKSAVFLMLLFYKNLYNMENYCVT